MAMGETQLKLDIPDSGTDLHFVDHVETKLVSPDREIISPTKAALKTPFSETENSQQENENKPEAIPEKIGESPSNNSDSGLDVSNNSSEIHEESFVDRCESYIEANDLESVTPSSPNKTVDMLFNFLNSSSTQSLDALNNNSEVITGGSAADENDNFEGNEVVTTNIYLGKEVDLHERVKDENEDGSKTSSESAMNLYWYTSNLDVDAAEIEAFKEAEAENIPSQSVTSTLQLNVGNGYYKEHEETNGKVCEEESITQTKKDEVKTESWSPAFESASSRILDLASELKSEPKKKKNQENETIKGGLEKESKKHPWGLDDESRVRSEVITDKNDELPDIGDKIELNESYHQTGEDIPDAVGLVEINDRPTEQLTKQTVITTTVESKTELVITEDSVKSEKKKNEDLVDAIGYMELIDKPETAVAVTVQKEEEIKTLAHKVTEAGDKVRVDKNAPLDVADAIGYMELSDRPTEQAITAVDQAALQAKAHEIAEKAINDSKNVLKERSLESQILVATQVKGETAHGGEELVSKDIPDGQQEQSISVETSITVRSEITSTATAREVKSVPFDPFTIRRKFILDTESENKLQQIGGMYLETATLIDEYLDDKDYSLTLKDCWLRLRNKKFEMKLNAAFGCGPNKSPSAELLTNENEIIEVLMRKYAEKLEKKRRISERQLDVLIDALDITEFVTFETTRKKYQVDDFIVTLDLTNFGFEVGEMEIVAKSSTEMTSSLEKMEVLAKKLGFKPLQSL